jgi:hypothetical protein
MLTSTDYAFERMNGAESVPAEFSDFCADYHPQDRIGVVSPVMDDGVYGCAGALLACTTAYYDTKRHRNDGFFDYPQHFCVLDMDEDGVNTRQGRRKLDWQTIGSPWGNLDVWPSCKWHGAAGGAAGMLQKVMDLQIDRLFWPERFAPARPQGAARLPKYVGMMLRTHLKQVYYYATDRPTIRVRGSSVVADLARNSIERLPGQSSVESAIPARSEANRWSWNELHRQSAPAEFMARFADYFAAE